MKAPLQADRSSWIRIYLIPEQFSPEQKSAMQLWLSEFCVRGIREGDIDTVFNGEQNIVFEDEPTGALDADTAETVFSLIADLSRKYGKTVVMVTHSQELADRADWIAKLG